MSFEFHKEHYERYERLLLVAQASGNWALAQEAARMCCSTCETSFRACLIRGSKPFDPVRHPCRLTR